MSGNTSTWSKHGEKLCDALSINSTLSMKNTQKVEALLCLANGGMLRTAEEAKKSVWCVSDYEQLFKSMFTARSWRSAQLLHRLSLFKDNEMLQMFGEQEDLDAMDRDQLIKTS